MTPAITIYTAHAAVFSVDPTATGGLSQIASQEFIETKRCSSLQLLGRRCVRSPPPTDTAVHAVNGIPITDAEGLSGSRGENKKMWLRSLECAWGRPHCFGWHRITCSARGTYIHMISQSFNTGTEYSFTSATLDLVCTGRLILRTSMPGEVRLLSYRAAHRIIRDEITESITSQKLNFKDGYHKYTPEGQSLQ